MVPSDTISYQLEIYTTANCWRGEVSYASARRLTDLLNDNGHGYIELERSSLITWDGQSPHVVETFESIAINKKKAIAVVCHDLPAEASANALERVPKVAQRVAVYAPPIIIVGHLHMAQGANLIILLDFSHQNFMPLTAAQVLRTDGKEALESQRGLVLINRDAITAIQAVSPGQDSENPADSSSPHTSRMRAVADKVAQRSTK